MNYLVSRIITFVISPILMFITSIYFDSEQYGYFALIFTYHMWAIIVLEFGIIPALMQRISEYGLQEAFSGMVIIIVQTIMAICLYVALLSSSPFQQIEICRQIGILLFVTIVLRAPISLLQPYYLVNTKTNGRQIITNSICASLAIRVIVWLVGIYYDNILIAGGLSNLIGNLVMSVYMVVSIQNWKQLIPANLGLLDWNKVVQNIKQMFCLSIKYGISSILFQVYFYAPIIFWQYRNPEPAAMGAYILLTQLINLAVTPYLIFVNELSFARAFRLNQEEHSRLIQELARVGIVCIALTIVVLSSVAEVLNIYWDDIRREYVTLWIPWIAFCVIIRHVAILPGFNLITTGHLNSRIWVQIFTAVVALAVVNFFLIGDIVYKVVVISATIETIIMLGYVSLEYILSTAQKSVNRFFTSFDTVCLSLVCLCLFLFAHINRGFLLVTVFLGIIIILRHIFDNSFQQQIRELLAYRGER